MSILKHLNYNDSGRIVLSASQKRKHKKGLCVIPYCKNEHAPGRKMCWADEKAAWAARNPLKYSYANKKQNSKRKGIPFELSFEEFKKFAVPVKDLFGRGKKDYHIGRINEDPQKGYHGYRADNIVLVTNTENQAMRTKDFWYNPETKKVEFMTTTRVEENKRNDDVPF